MGCRSSKALPVSTTEAAPALKGSANTNFNAKETTSASASSSSSQGGSVATKVPVKNAGDAQVAAALRSKRKGIRVEGSSVQPNSNYEKKVIPKDKKTRDLIASALAGNVLFTALGQAALEDMIDVMEPRILEAGKTVISQGEPGDNFYVIESGRFEILVNDHKVSDWGEGTVNRTVGELALLYNAPRAATVRAVTNAKVWQIGRDTFRLLMANSAYLNHQQMKAALRKGILEDLSDEQLDKVAAAASRVRFNRGDQIIKKGSEGEVFYIIESGSVICKNLPGEQSNNVLLAGDYFGERALIKREPRVCDVYAESPEVTLIAVSREDFELLLGHLRDLLEHNLGMRLLLCVPILAQLSDDDRSILFQQLRLLSYRDGQTLLAQETSVSQFFIVKEGNVQVHVRGKLDKSLSKVTSKFNLRSEFGHEESSTNSDTQSRDVGTLIAGQWFGELEVEALAPSPVSYSARGPVQCFVLDRETYLSILAPYLAKRSSKALPPGAVLPAAAPAPALEAQLPIVEAPVQRVEAPQERLSIPLKEIEMLSTIGTGTFGRVRIVFHRPTSRVFALKILQKSQIVALKQQTNIMNERDILSRVNHPFIIRLFDTYRDRDRLYMLIELVQGGELFARLQNSPTPGRVQPWEARFYAACVLDAFDHLHSRGIVYRDLKPENLLIDAEGYLKIVDFGFAKVIGKERTYTLCGTPEYLAPELVLGRGHDRGVDYWALGVLLFEQVAGYSPFCDQASNDQMVICRNILKGEVEFPAYFKDKELRDLIMRLLVKDTSKRLGCLRGGAKDVKEHRFFRNVIANHHFSFEDLVARRLKYPNDVPWVPTLRDPLDTSNFDEYDEQDVVEPYKDDGSNWDANF